MGHRPNKKLILSLPLQRFSEGPDNTDIPEDVGSKKMTRGRNRDARVRKQIAMTDASIGGRLLPPLYPRTHEARGSSYKMRATILILIINH